MHNKHSDGDAGATAVAKRSDERHVGPAGHVDVFPSAGVAIAPGGAENTIEEAFNNPWVAANRCAAKAVTPPTLVLKIEDGAYWDHADAEGVFAAAASLRVILPDHAVLTVFQKC